MIKKCFLKALLIVCVTVFAICMFGCSDSDKTLNEGEKYTAKLIYQEVSLSSVPSGFEIKTSDKKLYIDGSFIGSLEEVENLNANFCDGELYSAVQNSDISISDIMSLNAGTKVNMQAEYGLANEIYFAKCNGKTVMLYYSADTVYRIYELI